MNGNWNLDILYKSYDDVKYLSDKERVKELINELDNLSNLSNMEDINYIEQYLLKMEELEKIVYDLYAYSSLRLSTNVNDSVASANIGEIMMILQEQVPSSVTFSKRIKNLDLEALCASSDIIKKYQFNLSNEIRDAKHMLSESEEVLASKLRIVGSSSWEDLQSQLTSNLMIKVKGIKEKLPLSSVRNLAYSNNPVIRKEAYRAEIKSYKNIETSVAMALNNIKREVNIMKELRGYKTVQEMTLNRSNMREETLDAMIEAIKEELPNFRKYYYLKAEALGYKKGLPFYELFAPMGNLTKEYTLDEAKNLVLDVYRSFSEPLYEMGKKAFENEWIDLYPKEGKVGGAFCAGLGDHRESRVLTNFTGSLGDVQTLAHELGHAYHGYVIHDNDILNRNYPMPLAETASIFCQTLMSKKMINDASSLEERLTIIENSLQEDTQCIIDILSRYLFETSVVNTPISVPLTSNDLCQMMLKAQDESYGDGLDKSYRHPYMWLCKSHYYSAGLNFYNWPYAFGLLYAKGLYVEYLKDKEKFVRNYDQMLKNTALESVEEVAASMGIDVTKKAFWLESLKFIEEDITEFAIILKELKMVK